MITKELGLGNEINDLSFNQIVNKNIKDLSSNFGIGNISIKNYPLPNTGWKKMRALLVSGMGHARNCLSSA